MKMFRDITIKCEECPREEHFKEEHLALRWGVDHIRKAHPETFKRLERKGRMEARSQNGCGYFDSDSQDGWSKAQASFRHAWMESALKRHLQWGGSL